ncbi:MAG TPA: hydrogenase maturation protease [Bryobacteraceae bacterium]|nr:hydrogenase maturation protease [Bryobacteraceae bacterium]
MNARILVAGIGNIFLGDDGFGVEVAQRMLRRPIADGVRVVDFGIRGFDLAYALMDDYDAVVLIDALPRGDVPGTLYTIEPDLRALDPAEPEDATLETHGMNPMKVLAMVKAMGGQPKRLFVVGCEPENGAASEEIERMGLSEPVAGAVGQAVAMVESLVHKILAEQQAIAAP